MNKTEFMAGQNIVNSVAAMFPDGVDIAWGDVTGWKNTIAISRYSTVGIKDVAALFGASVQSKYIPNEKCIQHSLNLDNDVRIIQFEDKEPANEQTI